jgi:hypothetical protein
MLLEQQGYVNNNAKSVSRTNQLGVERAEANQQNLLNEDQRKAALSLSTDEITQMGNHITKTLMNPQASQAERDQAIKMQQFLPAIQAEQRKHKEKMEEVAAKEAGDTARTRLQGQNNIELANVNNAAGRYAKKASGQANDILAAFRAGKMNAEKAAVTFNVLANFAEDEAEANKYIELAKQFETMHKNTAVANKAGGMDVGDMTGLPTREATPSALDIARQAKPTAKPNHSLATVQQQYPGVPPEKLRELYKKKFGVDLQ